MRDGVVDSARAYPASSRRLDAILRGMAGAKALAEARVLRARTGVPLPDVMVRTGMLTAGAAAQAIAGHADLPFVDLNNDPPDAALAGADDLDTYIHHRILPWRIRDGTVVFVAANTESGKEGLGALRRPPARATLAIATPDAIEVAIRARFGADLSREACHGFDRRFPGWSARRGFAVWQKAALALLILALIAGALVSPGHTLGVLYLLLVLWIGGTLTLYATCLRPPKTPPAGVDGPLPSVALLIPLYREDRALPGLIRAIEALDYPAPLLDIRILIEGDDAVSAAALGRLTLPPNAGVISIPPSLPRTKPKAMNYALRFVQADIIGIFDAEDRPEADQIRKAARALGNAGPEVVCVQARLAHHNRHDSWITRRFAAEYSLWFDMLIAGVAGSSLPVPLGGTSAYIRAPALRALGGWDAFNVTEDCDLGLRIARRGWRCLPLDSTTWEEATGRPWAWVRQRSRWMKGFAQTWGVHMRHPLRYWREVGPCGFMATQVLLLGGTVSALALPLYLWALWCGLRGVTPLPPSWPGAVWHGITGVFILGGTSIVALAMCAVWRRFGAAEAIRAPLLLVYWPLSALAAFKAYWELARDPFYWDKTEHHHAGTPPPRRDRKTEYERQPELAPNRAPPHRHGQPGVPQGAGGQ